MTDESLRQSDVLLPSDRARRDRPGGADVSVLRRAHGADASTCSTSCVRWLPGENRTRPAPCWPAANGWLQDAYEKRGRGARARVAEADTVLAEPGISRADARGSPHRGGRDAPRVPGPNTAAPSRRPTCTKAAREGRARDCARTPSATSARSPNRPTTTTPGSGARGPTGTTRTPAPTPRRYGHEAHGRRRGLRRAHPGRAGPRCCTVRPDGGAGAGRARAAPGRRLGRTAARAEEIPPISA